jgi:uncharacterized membrane protein
MGENHFEGITVSLYGFVLFGCAVSYYALTNSLLKVHASESVIHKAVGNKTKERISLVVYVGALALSFFQPKVAFALYSAVAILWLYPDRRIESHLSAGGRG